ncbi:polysaccharide deacetylase family protein [Flavobacterium sp. W1B]|uniref:polysaccharide deacetylase family protein n=1 Tax=Flavobacterium sp. W1B TaxID=3394146 RepID=UPI0039BC91BF
MKSIFLKFILLCTFFLFSCENKKLSKESKSSLQPGIVLTFDDATVNEWFQADKILSSYSWKATFCVSKINTLNRSEIAKLLELQKEGHEIAGHSLNHLKANLFVKQYGTDAYIDKEINPMLDLMDFYSLKVNSFAYPYGARNTTIDTALLSKFKILRGITHGLENPSKQNCFYNKTRIVFGIDIDSKHFQFNLSYLFKLLNYAKQNNKILILIGHKPVKNVTVNYQTKIETLELICKYVKQNNMKFYTLSELYNLK